MRHHQSLAHVYIFFMNQSYSLQKETRVFNQVIKGKEIRVKSSLKEESR